MRKIRLLDCTLRDGGYVNNWEFGENTIREVISGLFASGLNYIECGFLVSKKTDVNQSLYNSVSELNYYLEDVDKKRLTLMISNSKFDISTLEEYNPDLIKNIRYIFKKHNQKQALEECEIIKKKGYNLFINPTFISEYSFDEFGDLIKNINRIQPFCFSIVDSIGILDEGSLISLITYADNHLSSDISLCLHLHNNLGIAFDNAISALKLNLKRNIIVDSTIRGIGRGSGNLPIELITMYLNKKFNSNFDIKNIYKIYEKYIIPNSKIKKFKMTNVYYYSAINRVHPNYADFIMKNNISDARKINSIFGQIPQEYKTLYNEEIVKSLLLF